MSIHTGRQTGRHAHWGGRGQEKERERERGHVLENGGGRNIRGVGDRIG